MLLKISNISEGIVKKILMMIVIVMMAAFAYAGDETTVQSLEIPVVKCSQGSPVINVVINDVPCKAASCQSGSSAGNMVGGFSALAQLMSGSGGVQNVGQGVKSMLSNALKETKCFNVVDADQIEKLKKIAAMTGQEVKLPKIDLFIDGAITAIEVSKSGGALGGGFVPIIGIVSKTKESANMSFDLSVLNPTTAEVVNSKAFKADSSKSSWGLGAGAFGGGAGLGGWSVSKSLVLDNVVRDVVFSVANHLADTFSSEHIASRPDIKSAVTAQSEKTEENIKTE